MRTFAAQVAPTFWTRGSGRKLRGKPLAQLLALYLMTSPLSNVIGLYYLPLVSICADTGLTEEQVRATFPQIVEIARYDFDQEVVWLPECARYQIGPTLKPNDKRRGGIEREYETMAYSSFAREFIERYGDKYGLPPSQTSLAALNPLFFAPPQGASPITTSPLFVGNVEIPDGTSPCLDVVENTPALSPSYISFLDPDLTRAHVRASEVPKSEERPAVQVEPPPAPPPSKPSERPAPALALVPKPSQPAPEPKAAPAPRQAPGRAIPGAPRQPVERTLAERAALWVRSPDRPFDPMLAAFEAPHPEAWPEMRTLAGVVAEVFGGAPEYPRNAGDPRCLHVLERWAEGFSNDDLCEAIRGAGQDDHIKNHPQFQNLATILKSALQVDRFKKLLHSPVRPPVSTNRWEKQPKQPNSGYALNIVTTWEP